MKGEFKPNSFDTGVGMTGGTEHGHTLHTTPDSIRDTPVLRHDSVPTGGFADDRAEGIGANMSAADNDQEDSVLASSDTARNDGDAYGGHVTNDAAPAPEPVRLLDTQEGAHDDPGDVVDPEDDISDEELLEQVREYREVARTQDEIARMENVPDADPNYDFKGSYQDSMISVGNGAAESYIDGGPSMEDPETSAYIDHIEVPAALEGNGLGTALTREFTRQAVRDGARNVTLEGVNAATVKVMSKVYGDNIEFSDVHEGETYTLPMTSDQAMQSLNRAVARTEKLYHDEQGASSADIRPGALDEVQTYGTGLGITAKVDLYDEQVRNKLGY